MRSTSEILETLKAFKPKAESEYGITVLGLFGSCARGQQHEGSDVDICFDGKTPTLITIAKMEKFMFVLSSVFWFCIQYQKKFFKKIFRICCMFINQFVKSICKQH